MVPIAIVHDVARRPIDLIILQTIVRAIRETREIEILGGDAEWQAIVELELISNTDLDAVARSLIEEQYGTKEGSKIVRIRQYMLAYFLKRYHLDEPTTLKAPHQAPLRLWNRRMAMELLPSGMRVPLHDTDAVAPKLMRRLEELLPQASEQAIMERALGCLLDELADRGGE
jgi:hypothetical protein